MVLINYRPQSYAFFGNRQNQHRWHSAHNKSAEFENDVLNKWVAKVALRHLLHRLTAESGAKDWGEGTSIPLIHSGYGGKKGKCLFGVGILPHAPLTLHQHLKQATAIINYKNTSIMDNNTPATAESPSTQERVDALISQIRTGEVGTDAIQILSNGINHDEDVKNAETEGYLRGRNEKIAATTGVTEEDAEVKPATFPRYHRRSVWDR